MKKIAVLVGLALFASGLQAQERDLVGGTYKVINKSWVNDPRCGSAVTLTGSMYELEAEFKLWDQTGVTWHYKGTAVWTGREFFGGVGELAGMTTDLLRRKPDGSPIQYGLGVRIARGDGGAWRAVLIDVGGNKFDLQQVEGVERASQGKILLIKNTTPWEISVYLDEQPDHQVKLLGPVKPKSDRIFGGIPERGRWYLTVEPPPDMSLKAYRWTLMVKEAQAAYSVEIKENQLR